MTTNFPCTYCESILTDIGRIVVWKPADFELSEKVNHKKKERERFEILRMLNSMGYSITNLLYKPSGQPMLHENSNEFISLSHSKGWFAIFIATVPIGIDIEVERASITNGKNWFVNPNEIDSFMSQEELHIVWGAKEAFYKKKEGQLSDLRNEVTVKQILDEILLLEHNGIQAKLFHRKIENAYLVWTDSTG